MRTATVAVKPAGGYVLVPTGRLTEAWEWYRCGLITLADLRVFFACLEMDGRRRGARARSFSFLEVSRLTGLRRPRPAIAQLEKAGLLSFTGKNIDFPRARGRLLPFPRRMLRHLARSGHRSLIATVLGHLFHCLFFKKQRCVSGGRCKASKLSKAFCVDIRRVKAARAELIELGWLERVPEAQWAQNRWGGVYRVNLSWGKLPPPPAPRGTASPPPDSDGASPTGLKNQETPQTGVSLTDVQTEDLKDTSRTLELHAQAVQAKLVTTSEADRLRVVAAAEHALDVATTNAPGLFATILRRKLWTHITQADEEAARLRIKRQLYPAPAPAPAQAPTVQGSGPSPDARLVRVVTAAAWAAGYKGDPFYLLRTKDPTWTRDRWDAATGRAAPSNAAPTPPCPP